ncbi:MAG: glycosyl transferase family 1, partial [Anaerolineales bacterium]
MNILFIVPYVPSLVRVRPYQLIRGLTLLGHNVRVMTLWADDSERRELNELSVLASGATGKPLTGLRPYLNALRALPSTEPLQAAYSWQPALAKAIRRRVGETDIVHVEHLRGARYGLALNGLNVPIVWDSVDCISELFRQASINGASLFSRLITRFDLPRTERYEGKLLNA